MSYLILLASLVAATLAGPVYQPYHEAPYHHQPSYHGPPAPLAHDGRVLDTPEVAHAKAAHLAAHAAETAKATHPGPVLDYHEDYSNNFEHAGNYVAPVVAHHGIYHGPPAPLDHEGRVVDTPEVAHAKAAHLAAHADELSKHVQFSGFGHNYGPHAAWAAY